MSGHELTPANRRSLANWTLSLKSRLTCGAADDKLKAIELAKLTTAFPQQGQDQVSSDLRIETYFEALDGLPAWAVREAREAIVAGSTAYGRPWGPGPIEFADLVKRVVAPLLKDLQELGVIASATPMEREATPAERARIEEGFADLKAGFRKAPEQMRAESAEAALRRIAEKNGIDPDAAMASLQPAPPRSGTFAKSPSCIPAEVAA